MNSSENNNRAASHDFQAALGLLAERLFVRKWCAKGVAHQKNMSWYVHLPMLRIFSCMTAS